MHITKKCNWNFYFSSIFPPSFDLFREFPIWYWWISSISYNIWGKLNQIGPKMDKFQHLNCKKKNYSNFNSFFLSDYFCELGLIQYRKRLNGVQIPKFCTCKIYTICIAHLIWIYWMHFVFVWIYCLII